jgi:hypothetical protein
MVFSVQKEKNLIEFIFLLFEKFLWDCPPPELRRTSENIPLLQISILVNAASLDELPMWGLDWGFCCQG